VVGGGSNRSGRESAAGDGTACSVRGAVEVPWADCRVPPMTQSQSAEPLTVLVDAENIRRSVWPNIPEQQLVEMCAAWAEGHCRRLVLVFDGQAPEGRGACETVAARNADDWITDAAAGLNHYWLVTSDRELRRRAGERAVRMIGGGSFAHELQRR
jgi:hypothetical protein